MVATTELRTAGSATNGEATDDFSAQEYSRAADSALRPVL